MRELYFSERPVAIDRERYYLSSRFAEEREFANVGEAMDALQECLDDKGVRLYTVQKAQEAAITILYELTKMCHEYQDHYDITNFFYPIVEFSKPGFTENLDDVQAAISEAISIFGEYREKYKYTPFSGLLHMMELNLLVFKELRIDHVETNNLVFATPMYYNAMYQLFDYIGCYDIAFEYWRIFEQSLGKKESLLY